MSITLSHSLRKHRSEKARKQQISITRGKRNAERLYSGVKLEFCRIVILLLD
jgi:hypothetical protein